MRWITESLSSWRAGRWRALGRRGEEGCVFFCVVVAEVVVCVSYLDAGDVVCVLGRGGGIKGGCVEEDRVASGGPGLAMGQGPVGIGA